MIDVAIRVSGLGKQYRIGTRQEPYKTFRDLLTDAALKPIRALRSIGRRRGEQASSSSDTVWALRDISFEVKPGEVVGIIGRNGAGKSTLLKILARITEPTEGIGEIHGRIGSLLEVGTGFHGELSGRENIYLSGAILGMRKAEIDRKFNEMVQFAEVEKFIDTPVKHYSSGMYLRLAFAVAAHLEPEILLIDEVLAVGDSAFQKKCLGKMNDVAAAGRTVLFVSHNLGAMVNLCPRAILLSQGRKVADGPSHDVVAQYVQSGVEFMSERVWESPENAPGNDTVRLHRVRVLSLGAATRDVSIEEPVSVEIEFWNLRNDAELSSNIHLLDKMGVEVLSSANFRSTSLTLDEWSGRKYPAGLFRSTCTIPGHFLNEGLYSVNVLVLNRNRRIELLAREVISFDVHDTGAMRAEWMGGRWLGVIRPKLAWHTEQVSNAVPANCG